MTALIRLASFLCVFSCIVLAVFPVRAADDKAYAEIKSIADRFAFGEISLPAYEGEPKDYGYLREYIRRNAAAAYKVDPAVFDRATLLSTTLLRDFVAKVNHAAPFENRLEKMAREKRLRYKPREDIAELWRYPSWGPCGHVSWAIFHVYKSFGYDVELVSMIDGPMDGYQSSHVTVQVFVQDLGRAIMQEPQMNFWMLDAKTRQILSLDDARRLLLENGRDAVSIYHFDFLILYPYTGTKYTSLPPAPVEWQKGEPLWQPGSVYGNYNFILRRVVSRAGGDNNDEYNLLDYNGGGFSRGKLGTRSAREVEKTWARCKDKGWTLEKCIGESSGRGFVAGFYLDGRPYVTFGAERGFVSFDYADRSKSFPGGVDDMTARAVAGEYDAGLRRALFGRVDIVTPAGKRISPLKLNP